MKLSKIYSDNDKFKPIKFNGGFNVIFGDIEDVQAGTDAEVSEHNLGKTSLLYLIDFLLLKGVKKDNFFGKHKNKFLDWTFFLEIELNSGKFLTIRRSVLKNLRISFKEHFSRDQDFSKEAFWDEENIPMQSKKIEKTAKYILENKYLKFDTNKSFSYRNFLSYLLRNQNDYQDPFRLNKFRGKDVHWKPYLFQLLGFNPNLLEDKYNLDSEMVIEQKMINKLQGKKEDNEVYKMKAAIEAKEAEKKELELKMSNFDFYQNEQSLNFDLVKNTEREIAELNKEEYVINHNIEQISKSLDHDNKPSLQIEDLKKVFHEAKIFFPENLSKNYEEVLSFSLQITKEREKYLKEELRELQERLGIILQKLKDLNKKRGEMLSLLNEKDTFIKYKKYQEGVAHIDREILIFQQKLNQANTVGKYQSDLEKSILKVKELGRSIKDEIDKDNPDFREIKKIFQNIFKQTFHLTALLLVEPNSNGNVDFKADVLEKDLLTGQDDLTGQGDGYTATKVLCASFVLAVLVHYSSKSFFRFAYHDGILESWGNNHKRIFITLVRDYCKKNNIQYIISLIKSDVPDEITLLDSEIARVLSDTDKLFGFSF